MNFLEIGTATATESPEAATNAGLMAMAEASIAADMTAAGWWWAHGGLEVWGARSSQGTEQRKRCQQARSAHFLMLSAVANLLVKEKKKREQIPCLAHRKLSAAR